jgi:capsular polysaccharide transport system ATP-binding protein
MIELRGLWKSYPSGGGRQTIAAGIDARFPSGRAVALLGRNGAGKSSLLRIIAGTLAPDRGEVIRKGTVSWPVGFAGSFHGELTGAQNTRFVARVHGVDTGELCAFAQDFAELGSRFHEPVRTYSSGMRSRLAFAISMGIGFDTYLVDEVTSVGDAAFKRKSECVFRERLTRSGAIVVSHGMGMVRRVCTQGAVLDRGRLTYYDDIEAAIAHHEALMLGAA